MADDDKPKKKGGILKWILLLLMLLALGGAGGWYYFFSTLPGSRNAAAAADGGTVTKTVASPSAPSNALPTKELKPFLVNLADPLGKRYIKLTFEVEMNGPQVAAELDAQNARIRDSVIMLLSSKTYADIAPTESKLVLQNELVDRLNKILGGPKITRLFFTDMVIQ